MFENYMLHIYTYLVVAIGLFFYILEQFSEHYKMRIQLEVFKCFI